jgi:hypothetical protein
MYNGSYYGNYRTRKFSDIFDSYDTFYNDWTSTAYSGVVEGTIRGVLPVIYDLLQSKYGNNHIANSDEGQFKLQVFSIIYMYGPEYVKKLSLQKEIRALTPEQIRTTGAASRITNYAVNPSTAPGTNTTEELDYINAQNVDKSKKGITEAYALIYSLLDSDFTEEFLRRFKKLFFTVAAPSGPLWYADYLMEEN